MFDIDSNWSEHTVHRSVDTPAYLAETPCYSPILYLYLAYHLIPAIKAAPHNDLNGLTIKRKPRTENQPLQGEKMSAIGRTVNRSLHYISFLFSMLRLDNLQ